MSTLFSIWNTIQRKLFPVLEKELGPISEKEQEFIQIVSLLDLQSHMKEFRIPSKSTLGHKPIIDNNPRRGEKVLMDPATKSRFAQRTSAERVNSNLKDNYGGRTIRVKGTSKVMAHLMFGIISITAMQIFRLLL